MSEQPNERTTRMSIQAQSVHQIAMEYQLSRESQMALYKLVEWNNPFKTMLSTSAQMLAIQDAMKKISGSIGRIEEDIVLIKENQRAAWQLTGDQAKALKEVIRHWLTTPLNGYGSVVTRAIEAWLRVHAQESLRLDNYTKDMVIQTTIHTFLNTRQNTHRSNMRKAVFTSVNKRESLHVFVHTLIEEYYVGRPKSYTVKGIKAQVALMRSVAATIETTPKGADTGFWCKINAILKDLTARYGLDRKKPGWAAWYDRMIAKDEEVFGNNTSIVLRHRELESNGDELQINEAAFNDFDPDFSPDAPELGDDGLGPEPAGGNAMDTGA
ncbi:hypothetical protein BC834DRAFT_967180 [Gloeopeniophorella convolvens]|nr:hypothetical protein BC834DRAFT_967180 [Gloeopeniophorella convolvens]